MKLSGSRKAYWVIFTLALAALAADRLWLSPATSPPAPAQGGLVPDPGGTPAGQPPQPRAAALPPQPAARPALADRLAALAGSEDLDPARVRDAFAPVGRWLAEIKAPAGPASQPSPAQEFAKAHRLMSVVAGGDGGGSVILDGKVIQVGQELDGFKLVATGPRRAVFQRGDQRVELDLESLPDP